MSFWRPRMGKARSATSDPVAGIDEETDQTLRAALGGARLPDTVWSGLVTRLAEVDATDKTGVRGVASRPLWVPSGGDAVPALAAAASFCILFQFYLAGGAGLAWGRMEGLLSYAVLLAQRWALLASTLVTGGR